MIEHALFPALITQNEIKRNTPEEIKEAFWPIALDCIGEDGSRGEIHNPYVHHQEELTPLYMFVHDCAMNYLDRMGCDPFGLEIYITKSWVNLQSGEGNNVHHHEDSHLSFVYYLNIPKDTQHIVFYNDQQWFPYKGFVNAHKSGQGWNAYNSGTWSFAPKEGELFVFPSKMRHGVESISGINRPVKTLQQIKDSRVSIAGDFFFTFKHDNQNTTTNGVQPIRTWRQF